MFKFRPDSRLFPLVLAFASASSVAFAQAPGGLDRVVCEDTTFRGLLVWNEGAGGYEAGVFRYVGGPGQGPGQALDWTEMQASIPCMDYRGHGEEIGGPEGADRVLLRCLKPREWDMGHMLEMIETQGNAQEQGDPAGRVKVADLWLYERSFAGTTPMTEAAIPCYADTPAATPGQNVAGTR